MRLLLKTDGLWVERNGSPVLKDVNLEIFAGEFVWLRAENGSGKTLLLKTLSSKRHPSRGNVTCGDKYPMFSQTSGLLENRTVKENIVEAIQNAHSYDITYTISETLKKAELFEKRNEKVKNLSTGEKQILSLFTYLVLDSDLIFFDEPFAFLDRKKIERFISSAMEKTFSGKSIFIATTLPEGRKAPVGAKVFFIKDSHIYEK